MSSYEMSEDEAIPVTTSQKNVSIQGKQIIHTAEGGRSMQPVSVGGTQINQRKNKSKGSPQERWDEEVSLSIEGKLWTSVCTKIKQHLQDSSVAIVTGSPGEGKTTLAHLLLNDFKKQNWKVAIPQTPNEYFDFKQRRKTTFLFNDMFGAFEFDDSSMKAWIKVFDDLRNRLDQQTSECIDSDRTSLKIIFVQRDYIWKVARSKMGKYVNNLFKEGNVCNVTVSHTLDENDKLQLLTTLEKKYEYVLSENQKQKLVTANIPHGFPHSCELLFLLSGVCEKTIDFLHNPITFLNETIMQFCHDDIKRIVLCVLLKNGGAVELKIISSKKMMEEELESIGLLGSPPLGTERFHLIKNAFQHFDGSYLSIGSKVVQFSHISVLHSAAVSMGIVDTDFVLRYCHIGLLKDLLRLKSAGDTRRINPQAQHVLIDESDMDLVAKRFISEMYQGQLSDVLSCALFEDDLFVRRLLDHIPVNSHLFTVKDTKTGHSCFYMASQTGKNVFLKELIARTKLTSKYIQDAVFGCCEYGNIEGLKKLLCIKQYLYILKKRNDKKETPFLSAAKNSHTEICQLLLLHDIDVNAQDTARNTPLHFAAEGGNVDLVEILIQKSCRLDMKNQNKQTALHMALLGGHSKTAERLLSHGADFTLKDTMGLAAMHCASSTGLIDIVKYLIEKGADINVLNNRGSFPLMRAAEGGHVQTVKILHDSGSSVNQANLYGITALHLACQNGHLKVVQSLTELGCDINIQTKTGKSGLMLASWHGRQDVVEFLVQKTCTLDLKDSFGRTAILYAIKGFQEKIARFLLEKGCSLYFTIPLSRMRLMTYDYNKLDVTLLERALIKSLSPVDQALDLLYRKEVNCHALLFAMCTGQLGLVITLLDHCPNIEPIDMLHTVTSSCSHDSSFYNFTPGWFMSGDVDPSKYAPIAVELLRRGADVDTEDDKGATILHDAAAGGCVELMDVLLQAGCTIDKKDKQGQTPLHYASWYGQMEAVQWLLEKNADPHIIDSRRHTALHYAILGRHHAVADVLKSKGCTVSTPVRLLHSVTSLSKIFADQ